MTTDDRNPGVSRAAQLVRAGLLCGVIDGLWAVVLTLVYGRTILGLFQGIASTVFGPGMFEGGVPSALLGLAMHFAVAFTWSAVFLALVAGLPWLRRVLASWTGVLAVAAVYGPMIWIVMSAGVIPLLTGQPVAITYRWWIQLAGHIVFVGLPIVASIGWDERRHRNEG
jgi:glucan phosphoethanolaminetransferase (alkaline phosphatase superfamily)